MSDTVSKGQSAEPSSDRRPPDRPSIDGAAFASASSASGGADDKTVISTQPLVPPPPAADSRGPLELGELAPGDRLGPFELVAYVGGGGMGRVFRALDTQLERTVALKILPRDQAADPETLMRFRNEARSAARLDHENIARVFYAGEDRGLSYLVFEFIEGTTIRGLVEHNGPLSLADALSYTLQVADALAHAAEHNIVHRDVKPSNVLITPEGRAKVIDMGLARLQQKSVTDNDLTASGVTLGTFDYISPEQARDPRMVDARSDIYSLGCALYYMLAGRPPFPEGTVLQKLLQHQGDQPPEIRDLRPELPESASRILNKMLAKDPESRYQSPGELVDQLLILASELGLRLAGRRIWTTPQIPPLSGWHLHLPWTIPIAALLCIVAALSVYWSPSPRETHESVPPLVGSQEEPAELPSPERRLPVPGPTTPSSLVESPSPGRSTPAATAAGSLSPQNLDQPPVLAATSTSEPFGPMPGGHEATVDSGIAGRPPARPGLSTATIEPSKPRTEARARRTGVLVVDPKEKKQGNFASLSAACQSAASGNVVELRYDGRLEEKPIVLPNRKMTIRAADGFHPVIFFRPNESDPVKYPRDMISLTGSQLTLLGVALELEIPRTMATDRWSLFRTSAGEAVRLEQCSLTIRNAMEPSLAYHLDIAFFCVKPKPEVGVVGEMEVAAAAPHAQIKLTDCVVRGEAVLLHAEDLQPVTLEWNNGLLATSEPLLWSDGGQREPQPGEMVRIDLHHLTARIEGGFCRLDAGPMAPYQLPTHVTCADSIFLGAASSPLVEQTGGVNTDRLRQWITWNGDRNFYQGFRVFWSIRDPNPDFPPAEMTFEDWKAYWGPKRENLPSWERVVWQGLPVASRPPDDHTPADYTLNDTAADNPARRAATDATDAGFLADRLPPLPTTDRTAVEEENEPQRHRDTERAGRE